DIISVEADYRKESADAAAQQLREAGFRVKRTVIPETSFWNDWTKYPLAVTNWNARPLGIQTYALAYQSGTAWNETGYSNSDFDDLVAKANSVVDADKRRE